MAACRMSDTYQEHIPVLLNEVIHNLITDIDGIYIDATFGCGSHSKAILQKLSDKGRLIAFDQDQDAVAFARKTIKDSRFKIFHCSFSQIEMVITELHLREKIQGILFDLGVSSPQLDDPDRGFSFVREGKLDMRMDQSQGINAMQWLSSISEAELTNVLWQYGEEKMSRRIAKAIVKAREEKPIETTLQLANVIKNAMPNKYYEKHPATRTFQAIRIAINQELSALETALTQTLNILKIGGRLAVISFHSLEDRIVKNFMRQNSIAPELPRGLPVKSTQFIPKLKSIGKAIKPTDGEIDNNPRARSAILRIAEKLS